LLRRRKASTRWMSVAVTNPHHAVDAYVSLEITTARKNSFSPASDNPLYLRTRRAYSVYALSLTTSHSRMWSDADRLLLKVTPRILSQLSWVMLNVAGYQKSLFSIKLAALKKEWLQFCSFLWSSCFLLPF